MWKLFIEILSGYNILIGLHISKGVEHLEDGAHHYNEISLGLLFVSFRLVRYIPVEE